MMTKDASRDTDVVPRGLVASLKARRAQEETSGMLTTNIDNKKLLSSVDKLIRSVN